MGSSPGFGSNLGNPEAEAPAFALFRLAFATAPGIPSLNLAAEIDSPAHSSIGTPSPQDKLRAPTACRRTVSGSISLPSRGSFHLSLTVLVRYRSPRVFSLGKWSPQLPTGFPVSRGTRESPSGASPLSPTGLSPSVAVLSRLLWLGVMICNSCRGPQTPDRASRNPGGT